MDINPGDAPGELFGDNEAKNSDVDDMSSLWHLLHPCGTAPVTLQLVPGAGRGLVASRDLKPGEVVLRDKVLLENIPWCLGFLSTLEMFVNLPHLQFSRISHRCS